MEHSPINRIVLDVVNSRTPRDWIIIDQELRVVYANKALLNTWRKTADEAIGQRIPDLAYGGKLKDITGNHLSPVVETLETGQELHEREVYIYEPVERTYVWYLVNTYLYRDDSGKPLYVAGNYVPIDKFKVIESKLNSINMNIIKAFSRAIGARDAYTMRHVENVSALMLGLAEHMGFSTEKTAHAYLAGIIHDIGKISIPEHVLNKPGRLTAAEFEIIKKHPVVGAEILQEIEGFEAIAEVINHHHERYDGQGYPVGLIGEDIPFLSRMLAICDTYDAMTSVRCYRAPYSVGRALEEIHNCSGSQFDPLIAAKFIDFIKIHRNISPRIRRGRVSG